MRPILDRTGHRYGRLVALEATDERRSGFVVWRCRCDCGNFAEVAGGCLTMGRTQSCGCLRRDRKGKVKGKGTHYQTLTPMYHRWQSMRYSCSNPNHEMYRLNGAKGIRVCDRWESYETFVADIGPRPSPKHRLVRIDKSGNFEPGNVEWRAPLILDQVRTR